MFIPQPKNPREERSGEVTSTLCFGVADGGGEFFETIRGEGEAATLLSGLSGKGDGYYYSKEHSEGNNWVFLRDAPPQG